jgi:hypothetical protein
LSYNILLDSQVYKIEVNILWDKSGYLVLSFPGSNWQGSLVDMTEHIVVDILPHSILLGNQACMRLSILECNPPWLVLKASFLYSTQQDRFEYRIENTVLGNLVCLASPVKVLLSCSISLGNQVYMVEISNLVDIHRSLHSPEMCPLYSTLLDNLVGKTLCIEESNL